MVSPRPLTSPVSLPIEIDAVVMGAGVAGLWTLARLRAAGFSAVALEAAAMGATQSIGSQGIIHGGVKYALLGEAGAASRAIAAMPERWERALRGAGEVDLRSAPLLSEATFVWTTPGLLSRLAGLAASKVLRTPVAPLDRDTRPAVFAGAPRGVDVYRVGEPVLDSAGLLGALAEQAGGAVYRVNPESLTVSTGSGRVLVNAGGVTLAARHVLLLAGPGNERLAGLFSGAGAPPVKMQRRPLHMVMARGRLPDLFGHCVGTSSSPRLTVSTAPIGDAGERVWYVGGQIAEAGVERSPEAQIAAARDELRACLPWIDPAPLRFATVRWERAEGLTPAGTRPELPVFHAGERVSVGWPSKLALAPLLADQVLEHLAAVGVSPSGRAPNVPLEHAPVATRPWQAPAARWSTI